MHRFQLRLRLVSTLTMSSPQDSNINTNPLKTSFLQFMTGSDSDLSDQGPAPLQGLHGFVEYFPGDTNVIFSVLLGSPMLGPNVR